MPETDDRQFRNDPDDNETDQQAADRAARDRKIARREIDRPEDPEKGKKGGHKPFNPYDLSGDDPADQVLPGGISPKLAGDRAKAIIVMGRIKGFIEKYSKFAVDRFGGFSSQRTSSGKDVPGRAGLQQVMSKEKVLQIVDRIPMMPSEQMMSATRALGNYIWSIHGNVRSQIRDAVKAKMKKQGQADDEVMQSSVKAASREFDQDSVNIKGDLNVLAAAAGVLKRSGGFGGKADMTFLLKVMKGYVDDSGQYHLLRREIQPRSPDVSLPPDLQRASGYYGEPAPKDRPGSKKGKVVRAKGPTIRKAAGPQEPFRNSISDDEADQALRDLGLADHLAREWSRAMNEVIELAAADRKPVWWDDL